MNNNQSQNNENIELKFSFNKKKLMKYLPFLVVIAVFLFIWALPEYRQIDPWHQAAKLLDSAANAPSEGIKRDLLLESGRQLKELESEHPYHARIQMYLGTYYFRIGSWDSSIVHYRKALDLGSGGMVNQIEHKTKPLLSKAMIARLNELIDRKQFSLAYEEVNKAIADFPDEPNFQNQLAVIYHKTGRADSAVKMYQKIVDKYPNFKPARNNLAGAYFVRGNYELKQKNYEAALRSYKTSINLMPKNPETYNNSGICLMNLGRIEEAAAYFKKAVEIQPDHSKARNNLNVALSKLGRK